MRLRGIDFGSVWGASGVQGFFGEGYWFHRVVPGLSFRGVTFVAKTTTLEAKDGYMPLTNDWKPRDWFPSAVYVGPKGFAHGAAVNSIGLSGPGAKALFESGQWQRRHDPFMLSFMSVKPTSTERLEELAAYVELLRFYRKRMEAPIALQINFSCPNVGVHHEGLVDEAVRARSILDPLNIPLVPKLVCTMSPQDAALIGACYDAIVTTNTIRWGGVSTHINEQLIFGMSDSPLTDLDPDHPDSNRGGVSGRPLLNMNAAFIMGLRVHGYVKPVNASGGVISKGAVDRYKDVLANGVSIGSVAMLRPWRVASIVRHAHEVFDQ